MTGTDPAALTPEEAAVLACFDEMIDALAALDRGLVHAAVQHLLEAVRYLGEEAEDTAFDIGGSLLQEWMDADESWADRPEEEIAHLRDLISEALMRIGDSYPHSMFAGAYEQVALARLDEDPAAALTLLRRAETLADDPDERAGYLTWQAVALSGLKDLPSALLAARRARSDATEREAQDFADAVVLEVLLEQEDGSASEYALEVLDRRGDEAPDLLGEPAMRALLFEARRNEHALAPPSAELAAGLRRALSHPAWMPEPLTRADFAVAVAWVDLLRDDLRQLEATLAEGQGIPFSSVTIEAQAALLDATVAFNRMDTEEMERRLKRAAPLVADCDDLGVKIAFRSLADLISRSRGRPLTRPDDELAGLLGSRGQVDDGTVTLFFEIGESLGGVFRGDQQAVPSGVRTRLDEWLVRHASDGDALMTGGMWAYSAALAIVDRDWALARERLDRVRAIRDAFPHDDPQAGWLGALLQALEPTLLLRTDRPAALEALRMTAALHEREGRYLTAHMSHAMLAMALGSTEPREALTAAVKALDYSARHLASLAGSSERIALRAQQERVYECALRAAAALADERIIAELLEVLRAQDLPVVAMDPGLTDLPLAVFLAQPLAGTARLEPGADPDVLRLDDPRPIRMPWSRVALSDLIDPGDATPATYVVPRPRRAQRHA